MRIFKSKLADVQWPTDMPLTNYVFQNASPDDVAMIEGVSGRSLTISQMMDSIKRFANGLLERGAEKDEVLAIVAPNMPEYAVVFHGVLYSGGIVTTINPSYTASEIVKQLKDSKATRLVSIGEFEPVLKEIQEKYELKDVILIDADGNKGSFGTPISEYLAAEPLSEHVEIDTSTQIACLPYSSGTTGLPKGVILTHQNLIANIAQGEPYAYIEDGGTSLAVLPFFHIYGLQILMNSSLRYGTKIITLPRFDLMEFLECIQKHKVTRLYLVPPIVLALAKHPAIDQFDLSSVELITSGAAPLSSDVAHAASDRIQAEIFQGYGMTELSPLSHAALRGVGKPGAVGGVAPNTECRIVDIETGEDLEPGESGELLIRGPQVMLGYLNNPEATAAMIDSDGWLNTGDVAYVDEEQDFYIVERTKELIKYKGFQISPAELEGILLTHPAIGDAAVIAKDDEEAGEVPMAFITLKEGQEASAEEIIEFAAQDVAKFKRIDEIRFIDSIPKSATGKILRKELKVFR